MSRPPPNFLFNEALRLMKLAVELHNWARAAIYARNAACNCPDLKYANRLRERARKYDTAAQLANNGKPAPLALMMEKAGMRF